MKRSRQCLLVTIGSAGDVLPFIALGRALRERGHEVTLATGAHFEREVRQAGLDLAPLASAQEYLDALHVQDFFDRRQGLAALARRVILPLIERVYALIEARYVPGHTVVVASTLTLGARFAQEKLRVPLVTVVLQPVVLRSVHQPPRLATLPLRSWYPHPLTRALYWGWDLRADRLLNPEFNAKRAALGLPPVRRIFGSWRFSPQRVIGLFPDWFAPPPPDWPPQLRLTAFPLDPNGNRPLPETAQRFLSQGDPPIVVTFGSAMRHAQAFFAETASACQRLGLRAIFLTPFGEQVSQALSPSILHLPWAPLGSLLPHCSLLAHAGGIGTLAMGFAAGIPQLVVPFTNDQPDNAARLERLGAGLSLDASRYTARGAAARIERLLRTPQARERSRAVADRMRGADALTPACALIEQLLEEPGPVVPSLSCPGIQLPNPPRPPGGL